MAAIQFRHQFAPQAACQGSWRAAAGVDRAGGEARLIGSGLQFHAYRIDKCSMPGGVDDAKEIAIKALVSTERHMQVEPVDSSTLKDISNGGRLSKFRTHCCRGVYQEDGAWK